MCNFDQTVSNQNGASKAVLTKASGGRPWREADILAALTNFRQGRPDMAPHFAGEEALLILLRGLVPITFEQIEQRNRARGLRPPTQTRPLAYRSGFMARLAAVLTSTRPIAFTDRVDWS